MYDADTYEKFSRRQHYHLFEYDIIVHCNDYLCKHKAVQILSNSFEIGNRI